MKRIAPIAISALLALGVTATLAGPAEAARDTTWPTVVGTR